MKIDPLLFQKKAEEMLKNQANALFLLAEKIPTDFFTLLQDILNGSGKLICCGIGKSAIIAQKIVATLNSTGTPAAFLHAAEALHGDLGIVQKQDIVILFSKSGQTPEIQVLLPHLKKLAHKIYGIGANPDSFLAKNSDAFLHTPFEKEMGPHDLAPTTSTLLQLVLGDLLAMLLMEIKQFSPVDFAKYHPGGALGKKLICIVKDLLRKEKPSVLAATPLQEVILEMSAKRLGATIVLDPTKKIIGIITDGDLRRALEKNLPKKWPFLTAKDIMTSSPKMILIEETANAALTLFNTHTINQLVVIDQNQFYQGILHLNDVLDQGII